MSAVLDAGTTSGLLSALQAISALALLAAVFWLGRRLLANAQTGRRSASMLVEERLGLDLKNALLIVRVGERRLLLATGEQGPARLLTELTNVPPGPRPSPISAALASGQEQP
jgi:flagellar biogenesis protein FliO